MKIKLLNKKLEVSKYTIDNLNLSKKFRIAQISDLHFPRNLISLKEILLILRELKPDAIFITGDYFDKRTKSDDIMALKIFTKRLLELSNVFYVRGNHELKNREGKKIIQQLKEINLPYLFNEVITISDEISLVGVDETFRYIQSEAPFSKLNLVLVHQPHTFRKHLVNNHTYQFSGHVHGGQFRFRDQGVFGPDQGLLLEYSKGFYQVDKDKGLFVSAGLGKSVFPVRLNNPSQLIVVDFS